MTVVSAPSLSQTRRCVRACCGEPRLAVQCPDSMDCGSQFPDHIATLDPVTQLYVSIDAATKTSLQAVDRPLFKDFWERFLGACWWCEACSAAQCVRCKTTASLCVSREFGPAATEGAAHGVPLDSGQVMEHDGGG